jgi:hypothetical protein
MDLRKNVRKPSSNPSFSVNPAEYGESDFFLSFSSFFSLSYFLPLYSVFFAPSLTFPFQGRERKRRW